MFIVGMFFGCYAWGYLGDRFGRMFAFKKTVLVAAVGSFLMSSSLNPGYLVLFSSIIGFGIGGEIALGGTIYSEFCPPKKL